MLLPTQYDPAHRVMTFATMEEWTDQIQLTSEASYWKNVHGLEESMAMKAANIVRKSTFGIQQADLVMAARDDVRSTLFLEIGPNAQPRSLEEETRD